MSSNPSQLLFSADSLNMWGEGTSVSFDVTWDDLYWKESSVETYSWGGLSATLNLNAEIGLVGHIWAETGSVNIAYPITVDATLPGEVRSGDWFTVDTSSWTISNAALSSIGPGGETFGATLDFLFDVSASITGIAYDPPLFAPVTFDDITLAQIGTDPVRLVDITAGNPTLNGELGPLEGSVSVPSSLTTTRTGVSASNRLTTVQSSGTGAPFMTLGIDIDEIAQRLFGIPADVLEGDYSWSNSLGSLALDYTVLDAAAQARLCQAQRFSFTPTAVLVDMVCSNGERRTGQLGDTFIFSTPTEGSGDLTVTATYSLTGSLRNETGIVASAVLSLQAGDLAFSGDVLGYGFEWNPAGGPLVDLEYPDGGLSSSPLYLYDQTRTVDLGSQTTSYTIHYSPTATSGGLGTVSKDKVTLGSDPITIHGLNESDYILDNDQDNIIFGYDGNDRILSFYGRDSIYGGAGNDYIQGSGDANWIDGGTGADTLLGGGGNDVLKITTSENPSRGNARVDGGTGIDTLLVSFDGVLTWPSSYSYYTESEFGYIHASMDSDAQSIFSNVGAGTVMLQLGYPGGHIEISSIERMATSGGRGDDLLIGRGSGADLVFDGGAGTDALAIDWSKESTPILFDNDPYAASVTLSNGVTVKSVERLLLKTGSGDDRITNNKIETDDYIDGGAGNDTIDGGAGGDTLLGGSGNDRLKITISKDDYYTGFIDGGSGTDTLLISALVDDNGSPANYRFDTADFDSAIWSSNAGSIFAVLNTATITLHQGWRGETEITRIERMAVSGGSGDDLLLGRGSGADLVFDGGAGTDALAIDWSKESTAILFDNDPTGVGATASNGVTVQRVERLLLKAGTGHDRLTNTKSTGADYFDGGAGDDTLDGGLGADTLLGGSGNDLLKMTITGYASYGDGRVDGGLGIDTLLISAVQGEGVTPADYRYRMDRDGDLVLATWSSSAETIFSLVEAETFELQQGFGGRSTEIISIERMAISGASTNDLLIGRGSGADLVFDGGSGNDAFAIDWSKESMAILFDNDPAGGAITLSNGVAVKGIERLVLKTGSGNDRLINAKSTANDHLDGGTGDDTLGGGDGDDTLVGGEGRDTAVFQGNYAGYTIVRGEDGIVTVTDTVGAGGTDTLSGIETLLFADRSVPVSGAGARLDFDGNGRADVVWQNAQGGLTLWSMTGAQATATFMGDAGSADWQPAGFQDFSGDGKADILWRSQAAGIMSLWTMDGQGGVAAVSAVGDPGSTDWQVAATQDFTGDGQTDILWRSASQGIMSLWTMNGTSVAAVSAVGDPGSTDWQIAAVEDFSGDGRPDIL
ncbi:FG-GAP-like repeat-containing protein, partial [Azospirillum tabaci]|uniref:FG-GAP-like repeat-containing protein n=1 Tax=Azospirillum tabaci TaxID=2752310 RepID=UPI0016612FA7